MGTYLNPGKEAYQMAINSEIFVDKSEMISFLNTVINTHQRFVSVSRPRRFGKTRAADMLCAYYDRKADSRALFEKLKVALDKEEVDEELYATLLSQLFVTDFYTLSNKLSSSDVGGLDFVLAENKDNFAAKAKDTMYKSVKTNLYGDRDQELPTVTKVSVDNIITNNYTYGDKKDAEAYSVKCSVTYDKDLGYPSTVKLTLVHTDKKLEVAKVN